MGSFVIVISKIKSNWHINRTLLKPDIMKHSTITLFVRTFSLLFTSYIALLIALAILY